MVPQVRRAGVIAVLSLATFLFRGAPGAAEGPPAPPAPSPALQRDIETVNRLLRQRQSAAPPPSGPPAPAGDVTVPAGPPVQARPAPPAAPPGARPAPDAAAIRKSIERLADASPAERLKAQGELRAAGAAAVPALIDALEDPEEQTRIGAVTALGEIRDPRAADPLAELLHGPSKAMWGALWEAFRALAGEAASALIAALESNDQDVRWRAVALMGSIRDPRFTEPLIDILNRDRSTGVRVKIASTLGQIRDRQACEALLDALHDW